MTVSDHFGQNPYTSHITSKTDSFYILNLRIHEADNFSLFKQHRRTGNHEILSNNFLYSYINVLIKHNINTIHTYVNSKHTLKLLKKLS